MAESARVESIQAIRDFRAAMIEFQDTARRALLEATGDVDRTMNWLDEMQGYWKQQLRQREEEVVQARRAVNDKKLYPAVDGSRPSAVEQEQELARCKRRVEEAQQKIQNCRRGKTELSRQAVLFHGALQRLGSRVDGDIPRACAQLEALASQLDAYIGVRAPAVAAEAEGARGEAGMARSTPGALWDAAELDPAEFRQLVPQYGLDAIASAGLELVAGTLPALKDAAAERLGALALEPGEAGDAGEPVDGLLVVAAEPGEAVVAVVPGPRGADEAGPTVGYVGPAGEVEAERPRWAGTARELVRARPELAPLVQGPAHWVVLVSDTGRLEAIWDADDAPVPTQAHRQQQESRP